MARGCCIRSCACDQGCRPGCMHFMHTDATQRVYSVSLLCIGRVWASLRAVRMAGESEHQL